MSAAAIGAVAAPIIGGIIGNAASQGDREAADRARRAALSYFENIKVPTVEEQKVLLEQLQSQGQLTPEMAEAITQGKSEMGNISTDPRLKSAQMAALAQMQELSQGGMNAGDKLAQNQLLSSFNRDVGAAQAATMQDFARRGQAGSGNELAAQLMNQQAAAERASQQGMDIKAQAERRALEAMMQSGAMAGQMQSQEFNQAAAQAQAQDAINRFNTQNRQDVMNSNVAGRNAAQAANLGERQRVADQNVAIRNQQEANNKGLSQQNFQNQITKANGMAGQQAGLAGAADSAAGRTANMWAGIGSGVGQGAAAYAQNQSDEERLSKYGRTK